ncbi:MAG TPA: hypothetical protein VGF59_11610 [Bryobacteraceae bacterium]
MTAKAPRFHISTRAAVIGALWLLGTAVLASVRAGLRLNVMPVAWVLAGAILLLWICLSAAFSCRCWIHTAVSSEELRSLYRTWTARRFLAKIEPYILQAQGAVEANIAEAIEDKQVGATPEGRIGLATSATPEAQAPAPPSSRPARTPVSTLFVASLCLGGVAELATIRASAIVGRGVLLGFLLLQFSTAVAAIVQSYLGGLRASVRTLAIVTVAAFGVWYYAVQVGSTVAVAYQNANSKDPRMFPQLFALLDYPAARAVAGGMSLLLGIAGILLLLRQARTPETEVSLSGALRS